MCIAQTACLSHPSLYDLAQFHLLHFFSWSLQMWQQVLHSHGRRETGSCSHSFWLYQSLHLVLCGRSVLGQLEGKEYKFSILIYIHLNMQDWVHPNSNTSVYQIECQAKLLSSEHTLANDHTCATICMILYSLWKIAYDIITHSVHTFSIYNCSSNQYMNQVHLPK